MLTVAQIISAVCNFLSIALVARMLGPEVQGEWNLYISAYAMGTLALGFGLPPALNHFLAAGKISKEHLFGQLLLFAIIVAIVFFIGSSAIFNTSLGGIIFPTSLTSKVILIGLSFHFFLLMYNQLMSSILLAEKKFQSAALVTVAGSVLLLAGYAYFFYVEENIPKGYFFAFIILNLVVLIIQSVMYFFRILKLGGYGMKLSFFNRPMLTLLFSFAAWAYLTNFMQFLSYRMDLWFVNAFVSDESQLGIYATSASMAQLIWLIPNAFHSIIFTDVSNTSAEYSDFQKISIWAVRVFVLGVLLAVIGYLLSHWLIIPLFGLEYRGIINVLPYLLPGIVLFAPAILLSAFFAGINRIDINLKASLIGFVVCLVLDIMLIPTYSIFGAAVATSASYALSAVYLYYRFKGWHKLK